MRSTERTLDSVLSRAFALLEVLGSEASGIGLAEMARRSGLPKATVHRLAAQLAELQVIDRVGTDYHLGQKLFELGTGTRHQELRDVAMPYLEDLYEAVRETVHLGVVDGGEVLYVERIAGRNSTAVPTARGTRRPLYCTAIGKAILAHSGPRVLATLVEGGLARQTPYTVVAPGLLNKELARIRETGLAFDREEYELGLTCVASPLLDAHGRGRAALSVSGPTTRFQPERIAAAVRTAALGLGRRWIAHRASSD
ncbi:IclR family transcriptional regulator [Pseudonocardia kongjuensis]|uniref:IclR family transcriptional regulator n=1 Tax=Pseudonocardia kongjuensis TaxID=102227 RepID=A0ABN1XL26_9PSEU